MRDATIAVAGPRVGGRTAALALLLYAGFLVVGAPASVLAWALAAATSGVATLEGAQGSLWRGRATFLVIMNRSGGAHRYANVDWTWLGAYLATSGLELRIEIKDPKVHGAGRISLGMNELRVSDAMIRLPAASLATYWPALSQAGLSGEISVQTGGFTLARDHLAGTALVAWRDSAWGNANRLGEYRALVRGDGASAQFQVETVSGALRVDGRGAWSDKKGLSFEGTARGLPNDSAGHAELLRLAGHDFRTGTLRIRLRD